MLDGFLVGIIVGLALTASLFFLKFWQTSRDQLFIAFALVFAIEGVSRIVGLFSPQPSDRMPFIYVLRMVAYLILIASIISKNRRPKT